MVKTNVAVFVTLFLFVQAAAAAAKKLTKTEKEQTLRQLVADGWLRHSQIQSGHYCIGVSAQC